ncbi:MAG TPA: hypothetical protein VKW09_07710 [bacterium]|nr:hypothetical protein [bacterium]
MNTSPASDREARYGTGIMVLALVSLAAVLAIAWGEVAGHRLVAGGAVGVILLAYSFILLFLRKGGFTGV